MTKNLQASRKRTAMVLLGSTAIGIAAVGALVVRSSASATDGQSAASTTTSAPAPAGGTTGTPTTTPVAPTSPTSTAPGSAPVVAPPVTTGPTAPVTPTSVPTTTPVAPTTTPAPPVVTFPTKTVPSFIGQDLLVVSTSNNAPWGIRSGTCTVGPVSTSTQEIETITSQSPAPGSSVSTNPSVDLTWQTVTVNYTVGVPAGSPVGYNPCTGS